MNKQCYIRFYQDLHVLYDDRYIRLSLFRVEDGDLCCHLGGPVGWECSYTGPEAVNKFDAVLALDRELTWEDIKTFGFTQYG
jgi:hypothetical protein